MKTSEIVATNARFLCKCENKTIVELETAVGVTRGYLSRVSKGSRKSLSIDVCCKIAEYLNVNLDSLIDSSLIPKFRITTLRSELDTLYRNHPDLVPTEGEV